MTGNTKTNSGRTIKAEFMSDAACTYRTCDKSMMSVCRVMEAITEGATPGTLGGMMSEYYNSLNYDQKERLGKEILRGIKNRTL